MSIASEMTNLAANRDAIKAAIEAKGVSDAGNTLAGFPAAIESIPSGGGGSEFVPPTEMPNIRQLLSNDEENYTHKIYVLFDALAGPSVSNVVSRNAGAEKVVTSDGATYTANATHTWDRSKLINGRYAWAAYYSSTGFTECNWTRSYYQPDITVLWIAGNTALVSSSGPYALVLGYQWAVQAIEFPSVAYTTTAHNYGAARKFVNCSSLRMLPLVIDLSTQQNMSQMFNGCYSLNATPSTLDLSNATNVSNMFGSCYLLTTVADTLNLGSVTSASNQSNMFFNCYSLRALPTHVTSKWSLSFAQSSGVTDKDSIATFANGSITGGFVGNLNTCPNNGQTITLNSAIKGLFTASEQSAIESAMTAKNWTLSW